MIGYQDPARAAELVAEAERAGVVRVPCAAGALTVAHYPLAGPIATRYAWAIYHTSPAGVSSHTGISRDRITRELAWHIFDAGGELEERACIACGGRAVIGAGEECQSCRDAIAAEDMRG